MNTILLLLSPASGTYLIAIVGAPLCEIASCGPIAVGAACRSASCILPGRRPGASDAAGGMLAGGNANRSGASHFGGVNPWLVHQRSIAVLSSATGPPAVSPSWEMVDADPFSLLNFHLAYA